MNTLFQEQVTPDAGSTPATLAGSQPAIARCEVLTVWPASRKHRTKRMLREMAAFLGDTLFPELAPADVPPVRVGANWIGCPSGTVPRRCEGTGSTPACQQVRLLLAHGAITPSTPICGYSLTAELQTSNLTARDRHPLSAPRPSTIRLHKAHTFRSVLFILPFAPGAGRMRDSSVRGRKHGKTENIWLAPARIVKKETDTTDAPG